MSIRCVFMGTPDFAVDALRTVHKNTEVVAVYTQPDKPIGRGLEVKHTPVKSVALELGLPVFQPEKLTAPGEFERLKSLAPDLIVVVAYGQILKRNVLDLPRLGCVNIHSSLLPRWRGAAPIHWSILAGDQKTGITTMYMVEKLDAGDILEQVETEIGPQETVESLHDRLKIMGAQLIESTIRGLAQKTIKPRAQQETLVTYASKLTKEMEGLDAHKESAQVLARKVRALNPWPGTSIWVADFQGKTVRMKIKKALAHDAVAVAPGFLQERGGMLMIGCQQGSLEVLTLQLDGKKEIDAAGFLNGLRGQGGKVFPLALTSMPIGGIDGKKEKPVGGANR